MIELAYLSALLEQHPHSKSEPLSQKVEVIRKFLEDVVHVVPLESIAYAIAYSPLEIAMLCYRALRSSGVELPVSIEMHAGLHLAGTRLGEGIRFHIVKKLERKATKEVNSRYCTRTLFLSKDEAQVLVQPRIRGTLLPYSSRAATATIKLQPEDVETRVDVEAGQYLQQLINDSITDEGTNEPHLSGQNIDLLYPTGLSDPAYGTHHDAFTSPVGILAHARKKLSSLSEEVKVELESPSTVGGNQHSEMLKLVNGIRNKELATCTALLSGFMEQEIDIPLVRSRKDQSEVVELSAQATIGVWALFSLRYSDIQPILAQCHGDQLLVKIEEYIKAIVGDQTDCSDSQYAAKLQFLVQGIEKTYLQQSVC